MNYTRVKLSISYTYFLNITITFFPARSMALIRRMLSCTGIFRVFGKGIQIFKPLDVDLCTLSHHKILT